MGLVIVSVPNPPSSIALMMPWAAVLEIAPANVLHGAVRLHGLASSPTPDTQVRVACALAAPAKTSWRIAKAQTANMRIWIVVIKAPVDEQSCYGIAAKV